MGQRIENNRRAPYASTYEERPQKSKWTPDPGVSNLEVVTTVSHLMEQKQNITMAGGGKYLAWLWKRNGWYEGPFPLCISTFRRKIFN